MTDREDAVGEQMLEAAVPDELVPGDDNPLEDLAVAARSREPGAFDALVRRIAPRVAAYAGGVLRNPSLAEEAVQETLIRIYRFLPRYNEDNFLAWCLTITHRVCSNLVRRETRHARLRLIVSPQEPVDPTHQIGSRVAIEAAINDLPLHLRETFLLHEQGLDYKQMSAVLGIPVGTVRSRLFRAREALRTALRAGGERM